MNENALFDMLPLIIEELEAITGSSYSGDLAEQKPLTHIKANAVAIIQLSKQTCACCGEPISDEFSENITNWYDHAYELLIQEGLFEWVDGGSVLRVHPDPE